MRCVALGLLAAAGCNQIWDLEGVVRDQPDAPDIDPNWPRIRLTTQIAKTNPVNGYADQNLEYGAISPRPAVQIGKIGEPLMDAVYEEDGTAPGRVAFPPDYLGTRWRLVYVLEDGLPREVHWAPTANLAGHIVEPLLGRTDRLPVPAGGGYSITPPNLAVDFQHTATRVFTTGIWSEGIIPFPLPGRTLDYAFAQYAKSISGPLGAPEQGQLDHAVLADFTSLNGCSVASGTATFPVPDLMASGLSPPDPQPSYGLANKQVGLSIPLTPQPIYARLETVLGSRVDANPDAVRWQYGYVPSLGVFGFSKPVVDTVGEFLLPGPRMIALASCAYIATPGAERLTTPPYADSLELRPRFSRVVHVEIVNTRSIGGIALRSGFSAVVASAGSTFTSDFTVAAPRSFSLHRGATQIADLADDADGTTLPAGTGPLELKFVVEQAASLAADYFDITLFLVANGKLERQRLYTVTDPSLTLDPSFLTPDTEYVFELRSYRGRPDAARTDFSVNSYPQYAATIFTRTFRTPPP